MRSAEAGQRDRRLSHLVRCRDRDNIRSFCPVIFAVIQESDNNVVFYLTVFICLVLTDSVAVFLRGALVACAITRLRGGILMSGAGCAISMI